MNKFSDSLSQSKTALGKRGQAEALLWLTERGFAELDQNFRSGTLGDGAGEVDLLMYRAPCELWLVEVKCHRVCGFGLLSDEQRRRLYRARQLIQGRWPGFRVHLALLWIEPRSGAVEFLENP